MTRNNFYSFVQYQCLHSYMKSSRNTCVATRSNGRHGNDITMIPPSPSKFNLTWTPQNNTLVYVQFEVLTVVAMKSSIFLDILLCSLLKANWCFSGACCLHLHCWSQPSRKTTWSRLAACFTMEVTEIELHPSNMNKENGFSQSKILKPLIFVSLTQSS
jgi:hypothetical protein